MKQAPSKPLTVEHPFSEMTSIVTCSCTARPRLRSRQKLAWWRMMGSLPFISELISVRAPTGETEAWKGQTNVKFLFIAHPYSVKTL